MTKPMELPCWGGRGTGAVAWLGWDRASPNTAFGIPSGVGSWAQGTTSSVQTLLLAQNPRQAILPGTSGHQTPFPARTPPRPRQRHSLPAVGKALPHAGGPTSPPRLSVIAGFSLTQFRAGIRFSQPDAPR